MSYQGPPSWKLPPEGGYREAPPQPHPQQWQPVPQVQLTPLPAPAHPTVPGGSIWCRYCGFIAPPRVVAYGGSSASGCLVLVLLCFGVVPGLLYLVFGGSPSTDYAHCQRCGAPHGPWLGSSALWIVAGVFFGVVILTAIVSGLSR